MWWDDLAVTHPSPRAQQTSALAVNAIPISNLIQSPSCAVWCEPVWHPRQHAVASLEGNASITLALKHGVTTMTICFAFGPLIRA